jgi:hypothetical protein
MKRLLPDFKARAAEQQARIASEALDRLLETGKDYGLAPVLAQKGAVLFPHFGLEVCGHQIAGGVQAALDCGAERVLALGVLHARTEELETARSEVAGGKDPAEFPSWGIQGPGLDRRQDWRDEFSLDHFQYLWAKEAARRKKPAPELIVRYPFLAGGHPETLPGIDELESLVENGAAVVATGDLCHHGIGYGDPPDQARAPDPEGIDYVRQLIGKGLVILQAGDHLEYQRQSIASKSDARDVGQVLRHLLGPLEGRIVDMTWEDMAPVYDKPPPTWVAGVLVRFTPAI